MGAPAAGEDKPVAVIGAGVIGLSWAALFAARGFEVRVFDPRPDLAEALGDVLPDWIPQVPGFTGDAAAAVSRVTPAESVAAAVAGAGAVQEAGPETPEFKQQTWAQIEAAAPADALLLSSSSGIVASVQAAQMTDPGRLVIGHPFNPPHILPLVEISATEGAPQGRIDAAMAFYRALGKHPVQLHRESAGFVANRLQIVVILEAIRLVRAGVVDVRELDEIVTNSLGIRWATLGPLQAFHLGGGQGGLGHILQHIGKGLAEDVGQELTDEAIAEIAAAAEEVYPIERFPAYRTARDELQARIIADQAEHTLPA